MVHVVSSSWLLSAAAAQLRFNVPIQRHHIATPANMPGVLLNQTWLTLRLLLAVSLRRQVCASG
jgi:hypothetical protein